MAKKLGTRVLIKIAGGLLVGQTSVSSSLAATMIEVSNKLLVNIQNLSTGV